MSHQRSTYILNTTNETFKMRYCVNLYLNSEIQRLKSKVSFVQSPLVIVDLSVGGKMSTKTSNSTITGEIHAKIDNRSGKSVHYNEKFHYYGVHYYKRRLCISFMKLCHKEI